MKLNCEDWGIKSTNILEPSKASPQTIEEDDRFLTTIEAAQFLRVCPQSLFNMTSNGQVPVCKLGRRNRYRLQDLKYLLLKNRRGSN